MNNECTLSTRELFTQLQNKLMIKLKENETLCPECKGLRFILVESETNGYIESCRRCYTGILTICNHCGTPIKNDWCHCKDASDERSMKLQLEQAKKDKEKFLKAIKIDFKNYNGKFILNDEEYVKDSDDVEEWIYEKLQEGEELLPDYLWATKPSPVFNIDIYDVISDNCENGYEDMYDHLDTDSPLLTQAQELITQWQQEQGETLYTYDKDYTRAIMLTDIINEISEEIERRNNHD